MKSDKEIELKLQVKNKNEIIEKLKELGAKFVSKTSQKDILFNSKYFDLGKKDQGFRLRVENNKAQLAFKGTPTFTDEGHKIRDEFETAISDPETMRKILDAVGFFEAVVIEKERENYTLGGLDIAIDELYFGTFLELEGTEEEIEKVRKDLGLEKEEPVKRGYADLQIEHEKNK